MPGGAARAGRGASGSVSPLTQAGSVFGWTNRTRPYTSSVGKEAVTGSFPAFFTPRRVVFATKLGNGATLTPETLFPFSQITLAQSARALEQAGISVEVIGIPESTEKRPARSAFASAA